MKHHAITLLCLLGAVACYVVGTAAGVMVFVAAGLVLEGMFWFRLVRRRRPKDA